MPRSLLAAVVVLALLAIPSSAVAAHVACGDVITRDTTLHADVVCEAGDAGVLAPDGERYALLIGADGVKLDLAGHRLVVPYRLSATPILRALGIFGHSRVTVANGELTEQVTLRDVHHSRLVDITISGYIADLHLIGSSFNRLRRVRLVQDMSSALFLREGSNRNVVERGSFGGIVLADSDRNRIRRNRTCTFDTELIVGPGADANVIAHNTFGDGTTRCSFRDGIRVEEGARGTRLIGNTASGHALDDGIDVDDPSTVLIRNTADGNGDLGIEAVPGVLGVGNRASGNGNPLQCVGVVCR